jgi:hypothetical protein
LAVESAKPFEFPDPLLADELSRLKEFAVLGFWAEITRLPGHWAPRSTPEKSNRAHNPVAIDDRSPHLQVQTGTFRSDGRIQRGFQLSVTG